MTGTSTAWDAFCADAWTDDWADLCDALGIDYSGHDLNSRELRKVVLAWAQEAPDGWARVGHALDTVAPDNAVRSGE